MHSLRLLSFLGVSGLFCGAWSFDLTTSYTYGNVTFASDAGGSVQLNPVIDKVGASDPIISVFQNLLASTPYKTATVDTTVSEIEGTWDVNQYNAQLYGINTSNPWKYYGYDLGSRLTYTSTDASNLRFVWLSSGQNSGVGGAYYWFAGDSPFLYAPTDETWAHEDYNPYTAYRENVNIGHGYAMNDVGVYDQQGWMLAFNDVTDPNGAETLTYLGGIHWDQTVTTNAPSPTVPGPAAILPMALGLGAAFLRRRRAK